MILFWVSGRSKLLGATSTCLKECKSSICTMSQLSDQIHYNNQLLDRIRTLENDRKLFGAQLKKMETKCKDDVSKIHTELLESRRKLKIAQDLSDTMSKQSRTYRVDLERSSLLLKQCQDQIFLKNCF